MTADIIPLRRRDGTDAQPPARLDLSSSNAVLDVLQERLALIEASTDRATLPMPVGERARAVRWAADMIIQIERLDAAERKA